MYAIIPLGKNWARMNAEAYDLNPAIQTAFTAANYDFNKFDMDDESVLTFDKILESPDYDHAKDSNSKRTKPTKKGLEKGVDKTLYPLLMLLTIENENESKQFSKWLNEIFKHLKHYQNLDYNISPTRIKAIWTYWHFNRN